MLISGKLDIQDSLKDEKYVEATKNQATDLISRYGISMPAVKMRKIVQVGK